MSMRAHPFLTRDLKQRSCSAETIRDNGSGMIHRLSRVIRGIWNYYILGRRPAMIDLDEIDREFSAAMRSWDMEFHHHRPPSSYPEPNRYIWKRTVWLIMPEWDLLDTVTEQYIANVYRAGRKRYYANCYCYRSRRAAMTAAENKLRLKVNGSAKVSK